ncbi:MAG: hypothetical protein ABEN55_20350 [Bradymonadaceae bacterium]
MRHILDADEDSITSLVARELRPFRFLDLSDDPDPLERFVYEVPVEKHTRPPGVQHRLVARIMNRYVGLEVCGWRHPDKRVARFSLVIPKSVDAIVNSEQDVEIIDVRDLVTFCAVDAKHYEVEYVTFASKLPRVLSNIQGILEWLAFGELETGRHEAIERIDPDAFQSTGSRRAKLYEKAHSALVEGWCEQLEVKVGDV